MVEFSIFICFTIFYKIIVAIAQICARIARLQLYIELQGIQFFKISRSNGEDREPESHSRDLIRPPRVVTVSQKALSDVTCTAQAARKNEQKDRPSDGPVTVGSGQGDATESRNRRGTLKNDQDALLEVQGKRVAYRIVRSSPGVIPREGTKAVKGFTA